MTRALGVIWESLRDWWDGMVGLSTFNVVWLGLSLTVLLCPPATAGLYAVTNSLAHGKGQRLSDFVEAARAYAWVSWRWALVNLVVGVLLAVNFVFYGSISGSGAFLIQVALTITGALWLVMQFYVWPFLIEQEQKRLRTALRNALLLTLAAPLYTLVLLVAAGLILAFSLVAILPLGFFTMGFLALLGNRAVVERLTHYGKLPAADIASTSGEDNT